MKTSNIQLPTTPESILPLVIQAMSRTPDARLRELMASLTSHLHAFILETQVTEEEFERAVKFLIDIGQATGEKTNEVILAADLLGVSSLVAVLNNPANPLQHDNHATEEAASHAALLGPFWRANAPFCDMGDNIARGNTQGADVSRAGVQRDLLPLVEGTTISTKYGMVKTDHILFIASGAFHLSRPSDLIPELQGRFPIRVELESLSVEDFERILTQTDACLTRQYEALLATDGVTLQFAPDGIRRLAEIAFQVNEKTENIGARRLYTVMEKLLEELAFEAGKAGEQTVTIDAAYVDGRLEVLAQREDLARYVL